MRLSTAMALFLPAFTAASPDAQVTGPPPLLTVAINTDIRSTSPGVNWDANAVTVMHHEGNSLGAESFHHQNDVTTYVFKFRDGLLLHNCAPTGLRCRSV